MHSLCTWLLASSPWLGLYHALPAKAGWVNVSHLVLGLAVVPLGIVYSAACTLGGRWRLYFPWIAGQFRAVGTDVAGIFRGERPASEGGGLFASLEGLLLVALLAAAFTGVAWFANQGTDAAVAWRGHHIVAARGVGALMLMHVLAVSLHLVDLVRD